MNQLSWDNVTSWIERQVVHRVEQIRIIDFVDIFIFALLMFLVIKFIVQRRAGRLALGLVFIMLAATLTAILDMKTMMFLFSNLTQVGIIALVIMFQPELRAVLEKIGKISIPNIKNIATENKNAEHIANSIDLLAETACDLAMEKTGALIVIERDTKLGEHIKTGTVLNAQLSSQLLKNIFYNKAPLHDGAVILRNYRILSAGCFLPLSMKEDIDDNLGTRHRAAIGITEVSDAVVLVVSEETGTISIVSDGVITRNHSYKSLKKSLSKLLLPNESLKLPKRNKSQKSKKNADAAKEENT